MTDRIVAGRYRLERPIGRGGMGAVWQAHDELLGRDVAIKEVIGPSTERALREARAAARLRHPSIVTVHDVVTDDDRPWIVMELVGGQSLAGAIREHELLTEHRTAGIGLHVLDALRAAHREGILHRDVKPANILLDGDRVVLTDFGIAAIDDATALTATGQLVGSPAYMAPERINGKPATAAADLWALGVTLFTAVTGKSPFQREDTQATFAAILTFEVPPPPYAGRLWPVIKGLLDKDPATRLTAEAARPLLETVAALPADEPPRRRGDGSTAVAPPLTIAAPTVRQDPGGPTATAHTVLIPGSGRRVRTAWVVLSAALAVLMLGGGIAWAAGRGSDDKPPVLPAEASSSPARSAAPPSTPATPVNPNLDSCLVGRWRMTSVEVVNHFEGIDKTFSGGRGAIMRIWPDGRGASDFNKSAPLTATVKGAKYVQTLRGTATYHNETRNGRVYSSGVVAKRSTKITRNGRNVSFTQSVSNGSSQEYICSETRLTIYGDEDSSTDSYERLSRTP
ncbi:serine/threonine-protein kinase [Paractinoplanes lichenicola]|uniref:non-specific serine/threonine protein kinase n=1 Tax=Paractinoplanes lichenicola TaxID=2802976 RepID=A0ABS1VLL9_9ACTN|nr:serine/threonine-protein kinase [Actinoplanes lichenicola]MBL7255624.1 serine/threonine protein kinase [Actinoplanes lichenicola]